MMMKRRLERKLKRIERKVKFWTWILTLVASDKPKPEEPIIEALARARRRALQLRAEPYRVLLNSVQRALRLRKIRGLI